MIDSGEFIMSFKMSFLFSKVLQRDTQLLVNMIMIDFELSTMNAFKGLPTLRLVAKGLKAWAIRRSVFR